jgi:NDP-sugar pyrophosphorylase family protein
MQVAILAGGLATRLGNLTKDQPKSMLKISGKPFLEYQLEILGGAGIKDIVLCVGHLGEQIESFFGNGKQYGVTLRYSIEDSPLGTAGALKKAQTLLSDPFFTMYGDSYLFVDFTSVMRYFSSKNKLALMTVFKNNNRYDRSNTVVEGKLVKKYSKQERTDDMVYIEYGANLFRKKALELVPENHFYELEDLFPRLIAAKELLAYEVKERFYEIGSPQGLSEFEEYVGGSK